MNTKITSILTLFILVLVQVGIAFNPPDSWQPIFLTPGGGNTLEGVEANFKLGICNGEDVVFIRFTNHNAYSVTLEWYDAVYDKEMKFIGRTSENNKKSLKILSQTELKGECEKYPELVVKITDFVQNKDEIQRYNASDLNIFAAQ